YTTSDAVSSMFSPAAYLTELYMYGKQLDSNSNYALDTRRPDLQNLVLSQANLEEEITTLALSNEILIAACGSEVELQLPSLSYPP
ncbi:Tc toxin subunit A, partial [Zooshikella sp. RANM57]|uniref:Tc toxin subunit A n=1 Tax=Zooshikella sp. RANM57 TaxID=3425863 RepID=UPI003D6F3833